MGVNQIASASFAYPRNDSAVRAELARRLLASSPLDGGFVLSTCLRVEVVVPGDESRVEQALRALFGNLAGEAAPQLRHGERAVTHLFRIAAGLESPILGEREILTQFRQGLIEAEDAGQVSGLFARLLETGVAVGRQARELLPGSPHDSMASVAAQAVGTADRVAVLGSGIMATAVVEALSMLPAPPRVTVVARHPEKVSAPPGGEVLPFGSAASVIAAFPAVISATAAKNRLLDHAALHEVVATRREPLLLLDMAMPPDFAPALPDPLTYLGIDDLARMADRRARSEEADAMVASAAADAYRRYRDHHEVGPLIGGLMAAADAIVEGSVKRFAGRLKDPADASVLQQTAHTVARALLARPVSYLNRGDRLPEAIDVIADAFGVDDE